MSQTVRALCGRPPYFPVRLAESVATKWVSSGVWTPSFLSENLGDSLTVKRATGRFFMYAEASGANGMLPDSDAHKTDLVTLKPRDFFSKVVDGDPDGHRYYFTAPVMNLIPKLMPQVEEWPSLDLQEAEGVEPWKCIRPYLSVWIGGQDVTTQAHYDVANNVFIQVYGEKEFWCYPPSETSNLHVFPDAHPRARKSQVDFDRPDASLFPRFANLPPPLKFVLRPGDALYIPPFWFHHVRALTPSISLNVFSESRIKLAAADAFQVPLPRYLMEMDPAYRAAAIQLFVRALAPRLGLDPTALLADLLESRYKPLFGAGHTVYGRRDPAALAQLRDAMRVPAASGAARVAELPAEVRREVEGCVGRAAEGAAAHLGRMQSACRAGEAAHAQGLVETVAAHLVELWAVQLLGAEQIYDQLSAVLMAAAEDDAQQQ
mmetsp:Transcript_9614/g.19928  ORF Transcript_9614/g.19928 Transcript_9614/m.19928 type:complete len:433 (-) Transcript_9614:6-1304(-)